MILGIIWGIIALIYIGIEGQYINTNIAKYPPTLYYLSYGISISLLIIILLEKINIPNNINKVCEFISKNSMWIYLWYILGVYIWNEVVRKDCWYLMWIFLIVISTCITFIQNLIVDRLSLKHKKLEQAIKEIFI